jgi:trigger factor
MSVVLSVQEVGPCRKQLTVQVPAVEVDAETERVVRELGRRARLPGFRRGKVPPSVVRQRFREDIEREVVDRLVPKFWRRAQEEGSLDPLAPPEIRDVGVPAVGEDLTFVATVEVRPPIDVGGLDGFELPEPAVEPGEGELAAALDDLRRRAAEWAEAPRAAGQGDRVTAAIVELLPADPGGEPREGERETVTVEVGDPSLWEELSLALTGLAAGQEGRFSRRPAQPERPVRHFKVRVERVEERDLPPLDDAFATRVGPFADLAALRAEVAAGLGRAKRAERRRARGEAALAELRRRHPVALPEGIVRHEVEHLLHDYAEGLSRSGVDLASAQIDWDALGREARPQAERRVHDRLLLDAFAERAGIEVGDDDFAAAVAALARAQGVSPGALRRRLEEEGRLEGLRRQLRRDRTLGALTGEESRTAGEAPGDAAPLTT